MKIYLTDLEFFGFHGLYEAEKTIGRLHFHSGTRFSELNTDNRYPYIEGEGQKQIKIQNSSGWTKIGALNSSYTYYYTDRPSNYFDKRIETGADMRAPIFYDRNDTGYYTNPNSTSRLNTANITTLNTYGTTTLGDGNNDTTNINDTLKLWATDSGDSHFYFGESSSNGYGDHYYWDSGYTSYHYSRYAGTDSLIWRHDTRTTNRITYGRSISFDNHGKGIYGLYIKKLPIVFFSDY